MSLASQTDALAARIALEVKRLRGEVVDLLNLVEIYHPPTALFTYSTDGLTLSVDGSASSGLDIGSYEWDFGDGSGVVAATHAWVGAPDASPSTRTAADGSVLTNLIYNPQPTSPSGWIASRLTASMVDGWMRLTQSSEGNGYIYRNTGLPGVENRYAVALGQVVAVRFRVRNQGSSAIRVRPGWFGYTWTGTGWAGASSPDLPQTVLVGPGEETVVETTTTWSGTATHMMPGLFIHPDDLSTYLPIGTTMDWREAALFIEDDVPLPVPYFYGDTPDEVVPFTGVTQEHTYEEAGDYDVSLTVSNGNSSGTVTNQITVAASTEPEPENIPPEAGFTVVTDGLTAILNSSESSDAEGSIVSYVWDFGDGQTGAGPSPTHTYADSGTYTIRLTVEDESGAKDWVEYNTVVSAPTNLPSPLLSVSGDTLPAIGSAISAWGGFTNANTASQPTVVSGPNGHKAAKFEQDYLANLNTGIDGLDAVTLSMVVSMQQSPTVRGGIFSSVRNDDDTDYEATSGSFGIGYPLTANATAFDSITFAGSVVAVMDTDAKDTSDPLNTWLVLTIQVGTDGQPARVWVNGVLSGEVAGKDTSSLRTTRQALGARYSGATNQWRDRANLTYAEVREYGGRLTEDQITALVSEQAAWAGITLPGSPGAPQTSVLAQDGFERVVASGWGSADVGGAWAGTTNNSVSDGAGIFRLPSANSYGNVRLSDISVENVSVQVTTWCDKMPNGSGAFQLVRPRVVEVAGRQDDYRLKTNYTSSGAMTMWVSKNVMDVETAISPVVTPPGLVYAPGVHIVFKVVTTGINPTRIQTKAWIEGDPEPATWIHDFTDSSPTIQAAGSVGLFTQLSGGTTNTPVEFRYDNLIVTGLTGAPTDPPPVVEEPVDPEEPASGDLLQKFNYGPNASSSVAPPHKGEQEVYVRGVRVNRMTVVAAADIPGQGQTYAPTPEEGAMRVEIRSVHTADDFTVPYAGSVDLSSTTTSLLVSSANATKLRVTEFMTNNRTGEILRITGKSGSTLSVLRGTQGSPGNTGQPIIVGDTFKVVGGDYSDAGGNYFSGRAETLARHPSPWNSGPFPDPAGSSRWYGIPIYLPSDFNDQTGSDWLSVQQFKGWRGGGPPLSIEVKRGNFLWAGSQSGYVTLQSTRKGTWTYFEVFVKWSNGSDGAFQVFQNGVEVVPYTTRSTMDTINGAPDPVYIKQGIYRTKSHTSTHVAYYAPLRVGLTRAAIAP